MAYTLTDPAYQYNDVFSNKDENDSTKNWTVKIGNVVRHPLLVNITRDIEYPDRYNKPASSLSDSNLELINQQNFKRASDELDFCVQKEMKWNKALERQIQIRKGSLAATADDDPFSEQECTLDDIRDSLQDAVDERMEATTRLQQAKKAAESDILGKTKNNYTKAPGVIWEEGGAWFTNWSHAPKYMYALMPDKQDPKILYREICDK